MIVESTLLIYKIFPSHKNNTYKYVARNSPQLHPRGVDSQYHVWTNVSVERGIIW
jgi:hypothetical protein